MNGTPRGTVSSAPCLPPARLSGAAAEFYDDLRLAPLLRNVLRQSSRLLDGVAGSVSMVLPGAERYTKVAEAGASCQLGRSFPVDEGATGQVLRQRRPVVLDCYADVVRGHLPVGHPAHAGAAVAVPIWWRGDVVGANVVFAGRRRRFTAAEVDGFDVLTQAAAAAIATAGAGTPALAHLLGGGGGRVRRPASEVGVQPGWSPVAGVGSLTSREREVLALVVRGLGDPQIADVLGISRKTVEKHVGAVLRKTGTTSRTAAAVEAVTSGWSQDVATGHVPQNGESSPYPRSGVPGHPSPEAPTAVAVDEGAACLSFR